MKYTVIQVLAPYWGVFVVSLLVALAATPIMRYIAYRTGIVDRPDALLKPHARPIAYLGGLAICLGLLAGLAVYLVAMPDVRAMWQAMKEHLADGRLHALGCDPLWNLMGIAAAVVVITLVGLFDDLWDISPRQKILGQVLAAGLLLLGGVGDRMVGTLTGLLVTSWPAWLVLAASAIMCLVIVVATCNAVNLLDGLDGLCGGVTGIITLGFLALAVSLAMWGINPGQDSLRVVLCLAMLGAVVGFLPYNLPPASIFMGDAGSMLLGFFVATSMALFCIEDNPRWLAGAAVVFALPILDTSLAVIRRFLAGKSIFAGDRSHLYDQLVDRGMSVKKVVLLFYMLALLTAALGVLCAMFIRLRYAIVIYAVFFAGAAVVFWRLRMIRPAPRKPSTPAEDAQTPHHD